MTKEELGSRFREIRISQNLSTRDVASLSGIAHQNISRIEKGKYSMGLRVIQKMCKGLDCEMKIVEK